MRRKNMFVAFIALGAVLLICVGLGLFFFVSFGKAMYEPGALSRAVQAGQVPLDPAGPIVYGGAHPDGTREFSLEAEPGITLAGFERGEGAPVLVVHGGPGFPSDEPWSGPSSLESSRRFVYWHQRGSGRSTRPIDRFPTNNFPANVAELDARLGMAAQIADIERLRRALGVEKIDLLGHSFGGLIACLYAIEFPDRVGALALAAPAPMIVFPPASGGLYEEIRSKLPKEELPAYDRWLKDFFDYGKLFSRSEDDLRQLNAGVIRFYRDAMEARGESMTADVTGSDTELVGGWMMQAIFFGLGKRHDWSAAFAGIRARTLLGFGSRDLTEAVSFDQYRVIPGAIFKEAPGADHFIVEDPESFAEVFGDFLR